MAIRRRPARCITENTWRVRSRKNIRKIVNKFIADFEVVHEFVEIPEGLNPEIAKLLGEFSHLKYSFDERAMKLRREELVEVIIEHASSTDAFANMCKFSNAVDDLLSRRKSAQNLKDIVESDLDEKFKDVVVQLK